MSTFTGIKPENSSTLCKFHEGRKGLRPMGSNSLRVPLSRFCAEVESYLKLSGW